MLIVLNDRIPDGRDVSWIWDVDFEVIPQTTNITVSGDRVYDLAIRLKYTMQQCNNAAMKQLAIIENLSEAVSSGINKTGNDEILFILPTYSAMLEVRKIITGHKIL
jgi:lipid II isoglutaminyl synthase (glutamine-hydrolysing)